MAKPLQTNPPDPQAQLYGARENRGASGLGLKSFVRTEGLPPGRLHYWTHQTEVGLPGGMAVRFNARRLGGGCSGLAEPVASYAGVSGPDARRWKEGF